MSILVAVFAAIFLMIGLPMMIFGSIGMYRAYASRFWPETKGEISR
jgi:multisubunit Na+/H+ antiporter MnhG subunit